MGTFLIAAPDFVKVGGMDRANYALAACLAERGDDLRLVAHRAAEDLTARPNVTFHRAPKPLNAYILGNPFLHRVGLRAAAQTARDGGRVIVNGGCTDWDDVNWVHHVHGADAPTGGGNLALRIKNRLVYRMWLAEERRIIPRSRLILTTCGLTRRTLLEHVPGVRPERVEVVYLGVDPKIFRPADAAERAETRARLGWAEHRPTAMFIGSLGTRRKGFDLLYAAWEALCREPDWDADLVVVGSGSELPVWRERAEAAGLADRIRLVGSRRDLPEMLRAADGHVLPSRYEGYSMVTHEALCCGLPALVTASAGIAERYPEALRDWLIPDPEDVPDLTARLRRWREGVGRPRPDLVSFSEGLRAYTWQHMAARMVDLVEGAPAPAPPPAVPESPALGAAS